MSRLIENDQKLWNCFCDIEVAFVSIEFKDVFHLIDDFDIAGYSLEDKTRSGWGCVISQDDEWEGDRRNISKLIQDFLIKVEPSIFKVRKKSPHTKATLRVGVYYDSITFTLPIDQNTIKRMEHAGIELELSLYPSSDD